MATPTLTDPQLSGAGVSSVKRFHLLADNAGKRRTEIIYLCWFICTVPLQLLTTRHLSYTHSNDALLIGQASIMCLGTLVLPVVFRAPEDRGCRLRELYAVRMGMFLIVWAAVGGFVGTDPWYSVLHGHFGFNTHVNPNGVPLFMLIMTVSVFGAYSVILGSLYRLLDQLLDYCGAKAFSGAPRHLVLAVVLAPLMPLVETAGYTSKNYCFDPGPGKWALNLLIYGSWHFAGLVFYTRFDRLPGERTPFVQVLTSAFAAVGIIVALTTFTTAEIAPHYTDVRPGARYVNDWSSLNCLGPKPGS